MVDSVNLAQSGADNRIVFGCKFTVQDSPYNQHRNNKQTDQAKSDIQQEQGDINTLRLKGLIEENTELPTYLEKDANAMALGEQWYGNGRHFNSMIYVNADMSIGSGLILDQKLYRVSPFGAGEIGHCTVDMDGPRCYCGNWWIPSIR